MQQRHWREQVGNRVKKSLSLAFIAAGRDNVTREIHKQRREQLQMSLERVTMAYDKDRKVYNRTLEDQAINEDHFQNLFDIIRITFNNKFTKQSPTVLDLNVLFGSTVDGFFRYIL